MWFSRTGQDRVQSQYRINVEKWRHCTFLSCAYERIEPPYGHASGFSPSISCVFRAHDRLTLPALQVCKALHMLARRAIATKTPDALPADLADQPDIGSSCFVVSSFFSLGTHGLANTKFRSMKLYFMLGMGRTLDRTSSASASAKRPAL